MTTNPQKNRNNNSRIGDDVKNSGEAKQHKPDKNNHNKPIFFAPNRCESKPLITQAIPPKPMIKNENKETFKWVFGL